MKEYIVTDVNNNQKVKSLTCIGLIFISVLNMYFGIKHYNPINFIIGVVGIFYWGVLSIHFFTRKEDQRLIINDSCIIDNTTALSIGMIPWSNINSVEIKRICGQAFIAVEIKDINLLMREISKIKKIGIRLNYVFSSKAPAVFLFIDKDYNYTCNEVMYLLKEKLDKFK